MKFYNTLTKAVEEFRPLQPNHIRIYSCGPTVYDHLHIGNLRAFVVADLLRRCVQSSLPTGAKLTHVMNITDVDDKTISRSQQDYPGLEPSDALTKLTGKFTAIFLNDMKRIGNDLTGLTLTQATEPENITAMQALIKRLYDKKFAYIAEDGVYFSIANYQAAGKKYGQLTPVTADSTSSARINNDEYDKESAHDFALWKLQKSGEPAWPFELDGQALAGRPGWHVECSAMSKRLLDQPFDIHTGGVDLKFPHHENEIAQSTAAVDNPIYARFFLHNEHMLIDAQKMSKSLGNIYTLDTLIGRGHDPLALRVLLLQAHYRSQINFTWDSLSSAQNFLYRLRAWADLRFQPSVQTAGDAKPIYRATVAKIKESIAEDLNSAGALSQLSDLVSAAEEAGADIEALEETLEVVDSLLGLNLLTSEDISADQKALIAQRQAARDNQDWSTADKLRQTLIEQGLEINDTARGPIWSRLS